MLLGESPGYARDAELQLRLRLLPVADADGAQGRIAVIVERVGELLGEGEKLISHVD